MCALRIVGRNTNSTRGKGVEYLEKKLGYEPKYIAVSKFYEADESWTKKPTWWYDLPLQKIEDTPNGCYFLVCENVNNEYIVILVPNEYLLVKKSDLEIRNDGVVRLHLAAYKENWLVDERGKGGVPFSQFEMNI